MTAVERKFFFLHVMKTGGRTLFMHILANFDRPRVYPYGRLDPDLRRANYRIDYLLSLPPPRQAEIEVFTGHFPFVTVELLGLDATTITVLRDPVERTLSYLRHCELYHERHQGMALEAIYEDEFFNPCFIQDHQAKLFAFTADDRPESFMDRLEIDADRLQIATENLEKVDVVGIQERYDELLAELEARFGWYFGKIRNRRVNPGGEVPASFRRRIAEDNAADMEFYEYALSLHERRRSSRGTA